MKNLCWPDRCAHMHTITRFSTVFGFFFYIFFYRLLSRKGFPLLFLSEMKNSRQIMGLSSSSDHGTEALLNISIKQNESRTVRDEPPIDKTKRNKTKKKIHKTSTGSIQVICVTQCFHQCMKNNFLSAQIHKRKKLPLTSQYFKMRIMWQQ